MGGVLRRTGGAVEVGGRVEEGVEVEVMEEGVEEGMLVVVEGDVRSEVEHRDRELGGLVVGLSGGS